jgi:S1-C subfamily serine protease
LLFFDVLGQKMRHILFLGVALALLLSGRPLCAENPDDSLLIYAVNIHRTPTQSWPGSGIYLGKGLFITAAHVVGNAWLTRPKVVIDEKEYPTRVVKEGSLEGTDLTLLSVEEDQLPIRLRLRRNPLCVEHPWAGEEVITVVPGGTARSRIIPPEKLPLNVRNFSTVIGDVARTGNSGSGVFDAQRRCLLGIMSRKISLSGKRADTGKRETRDIAKYFVPAATISAFIPTELRF